MRHHIPDQHRTAPPISGQLKELLSFLSQKLPDLLASTGLDMIDPKHFKPGIGDCLSRLFYAMTSDARAQAFSISRGYPASKQETHPDH